MNEKAIQTLQHARMDAINRLNNAMPRKIAAERARRSVLEEMRQAQADIDAHEEALVELGADLEAPKTAVEEMFGTVKQGI